MGLRLVADVPGNVETGKRIVRVYLSGQKIISGNIVVSLERPATVRERQVRRFLVESTKTGPNGYEYDAELSFPSAGLWEVLMEARVNGEAEVFAKQRVVVASLSGTPGLE